MTIIQKSSHAGWNHTRANPSFLVSPEEFVQLDVSILRGEGWVSVLGWPESSFELFCKML